MHVIGTHAFIKYIHLYLPVIHHQNPLLTVMKTSRRKIAIESGGQKLRQRLDIRDYGGGYQSIRANELSMKRDKIYQLLND